MNSLDVLVDVFSQALGIDRRSVNETLEYNAIPEWDSVSHMVLIAAIDSKFGIMLETDDVIDLSSFSKAIAILTKYGIVF